MLPMLFGQSCFRNDPDGGQTFPTVLSASTANDGSENVVIPNLNTTTGRINAVDVIFHDITNETRISEELQQCRTQVNLLLGEKSIGQTNGKNDPGVRQW